jgi:hypothetical protein
VERLQALDQRAATSVLCSPGLDKSRSRSYFGKARPWLLRARETEVGAAEDRIATGQLSAPSADRKHSVIVFVCSVLGVLVDPERDEVRTFGQRVAARLEREVRIDLPTRETTVWNRANAGTYKNKCRAMYVSFSDGSTSRSPASSSDRRTLRADGQGPGVRLKASCRAFSIFSCATLQARARYACRIGHHVSRQQERTLAEVLERIHSAFVSFELGG